MSRWALVLLGFFVLLSPVAVSATTDETFMLEIDGDEVVVRLQVRLTDEDAQEMRQEIDEDYGNDDGTVTSNEVSRFSAEGTVNFEEDVPDCFDTFELAWVDDLTPKRISQISGRAEQATGPITSTSPVKVTADFKFLYPTRSASTHRVQVEMDEMDSFGDAVDCYFDAVYDGRDFGGWSGAGPPWVGYSEMPSTMPMDWSDVQYEGFAAYPSDAEFADLQADGSGGEESSTFLIRPRLGYKIDENSIAPETVRELWDGTGLRADSMSEQVLLMDEVVTFTVKSGSSSSLGGTVQNVGAYVGFGFMGGGFLLLAAGVSTEYGRFQLWKLLFLIPGFTRLEKDEVLEHTKRDELYRFIKQNPGPSFSDLRRELSLSNGTLVHHLRILEAQEYVKGVRDGFRTRFYVRGPKIVMESYLTRTQIQLVEAIGANPGLTQKELSQLLGLPRESVSYHTKQLAAKGRLAIKQEGKWRRYWPNVSTARPMQSVPVQP